MSENEATFYERSLATLFRFYPLVDGCGTVANSKLARAMLPASDRKLYGRVGPRRCFVPLNDLVGRAIFLLGELDRKVGHTVRKYVSPGDTVLDVGANLGLVSLQMANVGAARIHAFEPNPAILAYLDQTLDANRDAPITLHRLAVGEEAAELTLHVPKGNAGQSTLHADYHQDADTVSVQVVPLGETLKAEGVTAVDFMKMDVEGYEANAIRGLFQSPIRPQTILFEDHDINRSELAQILTAEGYAIRGICSRWRLWTVEVSSDHPAYSSCHDFVAVLSAPTRASPR